MAILTSGRRNKAANKGAPAEQGRPGSSTSDAATRAYNRRLVREAPGRPESFGAQARSLQAATAARIPFVATIIAMLVVGLALTLLLTTKAAETAYQIGAAREQNREVSEQLEAVRRDVEVGNSAPALALEASKLGMIPSKDPATLSVGADGKVTVIGTPTAAAGEPLPPFNKVPTAPDDEVGAVAPGPAAGTAAQELEVAVPLPVDQIPVPVDVPTPVPPPAPLPAPEPVGAGAPLDVIPDAPIAPVDQPPVDAPPVAGAPSEGVVP